MSPIASRSIASDGVLVTRDVASRTDCQSAIPTATPTASIATSSGRSVPARDEHLVDLVADRVQGAERERQAGPARRADEQRAEDRVLGRVGELAQDEIPAAEPGAEVRDRREGEDDAAQTRTGSQFRTIEPAHRPMIGSPRPRSTVREPGASPGRSRRCEGSCSSATKPLAHAGKAAREGAPSQKTCRAPHDPNPLEEGRIQVLRSFRRPRRCGGRCSDARRRGRIRRLVRGRPFPVSVIGSNGKVTVTKRPTRIVSLSPTATETLFAIGAGPQVVAVDDQSDFPKSAPKTALSGFTPNVEAIAAYRPDLVVIAYDPKGLSGALGRLGITVLHQDGAKSFKGAYQQIRQLGMVTGRTASAVKLVAGMKTKIARVVKACGEGERSDRLPRADARPLLGDVEDVRRAGLHGSRPAQHRRRGRRRRVRLPAAVGRVRRLREP